VTRRARHPSALDDVEGGADAAGVARALSRRGLPILIAVLIAASLAFFAVAKVEDVRDRVAVVEPWLVVVSILVYASLQLGLMEIWRRLLHLLHGSFGPAAEREAWQVSQLGKYVPTGAMLVVTRVLLAGRSGGSRPVALTSSVYEFVASFAAAVAITAAAIGSMDELRDSALRWAVYGAPLVLLASMHPLLFLPLANRALMRTGREPLPVALSMSRVLAFVMLYAAAFAFAGLGILALTEAITNVAPGDALLVVATFSVGYVASVLGFLLPAGLGARESGVALALSATVPVSVAVSVAVLSRLIQVGVELLLAGGAALAARHDRKAEPSVVARDARP
jgi:hypothetical protein